MRVSPLASSSRARRPLVRLRIQLPWYLRGLRYVVRPKVALAIGVAFLVGWELRSGRMQARFYSHLAQETDFRVEEGPSRSIYFPASGPYNERLGYARLPQFQDRLQDNGFVIDRQARVSGRFLTLTGFGFYPIYKEKSRAGLQIQGRHGELLYSALQPGSTYSEFEDIPLIVVNTLLFIENREVLHPFSVYQNPAVEWDRLARAFLDLGIRQINPGYPVSGGSTLATQLEKIRYSPGGRTSGLQDKIRQMASASVRSYLDGEETVAARRRIVRDYMNSIPLAAQAGYGEVHGFGDGMHVWYGTDFETANRLLTASEATLSDAEKDLRAKIYRQALNLLVGLKKPTEFLTRDPQALDARAEAYLPLLEDAGLITADLRDRALKSKIRVLRHAPRQQQSPFYVRKGIDSIRAMLLGALGLDSLYEADRLDLTVQATLDSRAAVVAEELNKLSDPEVAAKAGIVGHRLLGPNVDKESVIYSFTLYEKGEGANLLRIQSDNYNQPLSVNEGTKLELGSTSKLRTLVAYLEIIASVHEAMKKMTPAQRNAFVSGHNDPLTAWTVHFLNTAPETSLYATLDAALDRRYSASTAEGFFTGGGLHYFSNFDGKYSGQIITVREAFHNSVNLPFIRMMRDIVRYHSRRLSEPIERIMSDTNNPHRHEYLTRFIDDESKIFLRRFYNKHIGLSTQESVDQLIGQNRTNVKRMSVIFRSVRPDASVDEFRKFVLENSPVAAKLSDKALQQMYEGYGPEKFNLNDRSYLASIHPIELWLVEYLRRYPQAELREVAVASHNARHEAYSWLWKTRHKGAQDKRILTLIEEQAFDEVYEAWKRQGFPFRSIVPSYATALGSSGDNPAALAELVGILINDGVRYPTRRIESLEFASGTPFETTFGREYSGGERVYPVELARLVRQEMVGVVEKGTARRAYGAIMTPLGAIVPIGGKTGTGDNRISFFSARGRVTGSEVRSRTATFVFFIGDRFFGTITAFVNGQEAANYAFTSALPAQVFRHLAPVIKPVLESPPSRPRGSQTLLTKAGSATSPAGVTARP